MLPDAVPELFRLQEEKQAQMRENAGSLWMKESNFVFTNEVGKFISYRTVYDCFKRIVKKIGYPKVRFHQSGDGSMIDGFGSASIGEPSPD